MDVESIEHLFWDCQTVQIFWNNLFKWLNEIAINVTYDNFTSFFHAKDKKTSYIFLFSKYYIYTSKLKKQTPDISIFKRKFLNRLKIERFVALQNDTLEEFENCWINLIELFDF